MSNVLKWFVYMERMHASISTLLSTTNNFQDNFWLTEDCVILNILMIPIDCKTSDYYNHTYLYHNLW